ncbi:MAG: sulfatase-like hydrolase/transferase [Wenzhouxiangellaceae bacterium]
MAESNQRWNFLIITTDEERAPPVYEPEALKAFRSQYRPAFNTLAQNGLSFLRHHAASTACSPSRTSIYTGHYPSLHGVSQTSGLAKPSYDPEMYYLDPDTVPALGDYFRYGGYRTYYKGKWHLSYPDIDVPGTHNMLLSTTDDGERVPRVEELYATANRLDGYGFDGWIGPDPHGSAQANMGTNRDPGFAAQTCELLQSLDQQDDDTPWLIVSSFTNPHDIVFFGAPWLSFGYDYEFPDFIQALPTDLPPTRWEDLSSKPRCQADYAKRYGEMFFRNPTIPKYYQMYYYLQYLVDQQIQSVYQALQGTRFFDNTIIIYTSDHGDMLGAHGGMHQKWYNAYQETLHVPLIISNPSLFKEAKECDVLSSHIDLVPTLTGLAGIDLNAAVEALSATHSEAQKPVGADLSRLVLSGGADGHGDEVLYFMTDDQVSEGLNNINPRGRVYEPIEEPSHLDTVITWLQDAQGNKQLWKYSVYFDNPRYWSDIDHPILGQELSIDFSAVEREIYNLSDDPTEVDNLANRHDDPALQETFKKLHAILLQQRKKKRLLPQSREYSDQY